MGIFNYLGKIFGNNTNNLSSNTVIDRAIVVRGQVNIAKGGLHINGIIEGNVISGSEGSTRVIIGKNGLIQGNIFADTVVVLGKVVGNIRCINIEVLSDSSIDGDIQYQHITVDGGKVMGKLLQIIQTPKTKGNATTEIANSVESYNSANMAKLEITNGKSNNKAITEKVKIDNVPALN